MVRSLWSAATGMKAQQQNVDTIANNLANVNTTAYKTEVAEFKSLLYQTLQTKTTTANGVQKPVGAQIGLGVRNAAITSIFRQGSMTAAANGTSFAINGDGFFGVRGQDGRTYYTRSGDFHMAIGRGGMMLTTSDGLPVLDTEGDPIQFEDDLISNRIVVNDGGEFMYPDDNGQLQSLDITIGLFQFQNPAGLDKMGNSLYGVTDASGVALNEEEEDDVKPSIIKQGYLEASNVQVADEMVNLIVAQRAYEMNSKAITTTDEMMQMANQLKR